MVAHALVCYGTQESAERKGDEVGRDARGDILIEQEHGTKGVQIEYR